GTPEARPFSRREIALCLAALIVPMALRSSTTARSDAGAEVLFSLRAVFGDPNLLYGCLAEHPLFALTRLGPVIPWVGLFGCAVLVGKRGRRITFVIAFLLLFVPSLSATLRAVGVLWSFRLPVYLLAILGVGAGIAFVEERWAA